MIIQPNWEHLKNLIKDVETVYGQDVEDPNWCPAQTFLNLLEDGLIADASGETRALEDFYEVEHADAQDS